MDSLPNNSFGKKVALVNILALGLFTLDRLTKLLFHSPLEQDFFVWPGIIEFNFSRNYNLALGFKVSLIWQNIFIWLAILATAWFLIDAYKNRKILYIFSLSLILIGAISNILDRISFGYVVDFIDVPFFSVFNLADVYICIGILLIAFSQIRTPNKKA